ncbi:RNA polymerase sigma factor [Pelomonas sp. BJYL3]|uniref:RNA polymerase sigma factor n=1 Tax=Pelomonas sp. BJYL3 TaxID=2976697 RepID=UPI0022B2EC21|nr:sigma-70 family RNA polymerase sigma factor [Pelomonas sp. BJYL3]
MNPAHTPLVEAARAGDTQALHELLRRCQPDLRRFARRSCANSEDAEDAVQLALWQLHRRIGTLRTVATFTTWLFRIVERECWRLLRGQPRHVPLDELAAQDHPEAPALPLDLRQDLVRALQALSPPYREVLLLRDVHELSGPEVAAELGLSLEAVKSRLHRARAQVRERLLASGYWMKDGVPEPQAAGAPPR